MKKILFIIMSYTAGGGAESLLTTIVNHLDSKKYKIDIIEIVHDDVKIEPTNKNITILPYIMRKDDPKRKEKMYYVYHEPEKVFKKFVDEEYDLYISFNYQRPSFLLPKGKKNISWIHSDIYDLGQDNKKEERCLQDIAFEKVCRIVAISDRTAQSVVDLFKKHQNKIVKLYNGIDIDLIIKKSSEESMMKLLHPSILFIGRLEERKAPERLLDVLDVLHKKYEDKIHLYYMGYGILETWLKNQSQVLGLDKYVHFLGYQDNPFPLVKQADICSLLSHSEGFSMGMLESHALGKPILVTPTGAAETMVQNPLCGAIVASAEEGAKEVHRLLQIDKGKTEAACMQSAERFRLDRYIKKIEFLFDEVINE